MKEFPDRPDKRARWTSGLEPKKKSGMSRRGFLGFLGGAGALGAASMIPKSVIKGLTDVLAPQQRAIEPVVLNLEKQKALDNAIAAVQRNLRLSSVEYALANGGPGSAEQIIGALEIPILPEHLKETSFDVSELHRTYPVMIYIPDSREPAAVYPSSTLARAEIPSGDYGNGFYWEDERTILSAAHVVEDMDPEAAQQKLHHKFDAALIGVPEYSAAPSPECVVHDADLTRADIHGQFVSIVGIDPDETSDKTGRKTYPGIAVSLNEKLARSLFPDLPEEFMPNLARSCMVILPPGEAKPIARASGSGVRRRAQGISGSPVFVFHEGKYKIAGVFWGAGTVMVDNKEVDVGLFLPIDEIRRELVGSRVWPLREES